MIRASQFLHILSGLIVGIVFSALVWWFHDDLSIVLGCALAFTVYAWMTVTDFRRLGSARGARMQTDRLPRDIYIGRASEAPSKPGGFQLSLSRLLGSITLLAVSLGSFALLGPLSRLPISSTSAIVYTAIGLITISGACLFASVGVLFRQATISALTGAMLGFALAVWLAYEVGPRFDGI